jgi:hypothetical protein
MDVFINQRKLLPEMETVYFRILSILLEVEVQYNAINASP